MNRDFFPSLRRSGAALVLASVLLAGCSKDGGGRIVSPTHGDPAELMAWVRVAPLAFRAREIVQIEVGVRNPTTHPIVMGFTECLSYSVTDANGVALTPTSLCDSAPTYELAPGEVLAVTSSWDGTRNGEPVPTGEYRVHSVGFTVPAAAPVPIQVLAP